MRLIDADLIDEQELYNCESVLEAIDYIMEQPTVNAWIPCSERLPEEHLCKDGEYDPSDKVLCQLSNGDMKTSRYWNHRHCKDTIIIQPWLDLKDWYEVIAWMPLPQAYTEKESD